MKKIQNTKLEKVDVEEFRRLYEQELKTFRELAKIYKVSSSTIRLFAIKNGIKIRERGNIKEKEYHLVSPFKQEIKTEDIEKFRELFYQCVPQEKIAKELNVCSRAISRAIKEMGLIRPKSMKSRDQYDNSLDDKIVQMYNEGKSSTYIGKELNMTHRSVLSHLKHCGVRRRTLSESQFCYNDKEIPSELKSFETMYDMYVIQKMSKKDIGEQLNVTPRVIDRVLKEFGIHIRNNSECKFGLMVGEKHPNWKGGRSPLYMRLRTYFQTNQARKVIKRDGCKCMECGSTKKLQVHHIKHFKDIFNEILSEHPDLDVVKDKEELYKIMTNDERMNDLNNLITYCKYCHYKVHGYNLIKKEEDIC